MRGEIGDPESPPGGEHQLLEYHNDCRFHQPIRSLFVMILLDFFWTGNTHITVREQNL